MSMSGEYRSVTQWENLSRIRFVLGTRAFFHFVLIARNNIVCFFVRVAEALVNWPDLILASALSRSPARGLKTLRTEAARDQSSYWAIQLNQYKLIDSIIFPAKQPNIYTYSAHTHRAYIRHIYISSAIVSFCRHNKAQPRGSTAASLDRSDSLRRERTKIYRTKTVSRRLPAPEPPVHQQFINKDIEREICAKWKQQTLGRKKLFKCVLGAVRVCVCNCACVCAAFDRS